MLEIFPDGGTAPSEIAPASRTDLWRLAEAGAELITLAEQRDPSLLERFDDGAVTLDVRGGYYITRNNPPDNGHCVGVGLTHTYMDPTRLQEAAETDALLFAAEPLTHTLGSIERLMISAEIESDFLPVGRHMQHTIRYVDGPGDLHQTVGVAYYGIPTATEPAYALVALDPQVLCMRTYEANAMNEWVGRIRDTLA